jgi:hypothetical protein
MAVSWSDRHAASISSNKSFYRLELNDVHFHPEIVSLPLRLIPLNTAPPAPDGFNRNRIYQP